MSRNATQPRAPIVRVEDASLAADGGPVRLVVSHLDDPHLLVEALAPAGVHAQVADGRLRVITTPSRLIDAAGRAGGAALASALESSLQPAVRAWVSPPPDVETTAGPLRCSAGVIVMGVLNVTPDSFSDGGAWYDPATHPQRAVEHAAELLAAGAGVIDVGGESTRPDAEPVTEADELARVLPVVEALAGTCVVSIDTMKANVARAAVAAGAAIVNDVSAGAVDGLMLPMVAELAVPYVLMHMRGTPRTMQRDPRYADVVAEVFDFLAEGLERAALVGIDRSRVILDPGIGFGKTVPHNLALIRRTREFTSLGRPVLVGPSRKSFIGRITGAPEDDRLEGSIAAAVLAVANGAAIVRVHDVAQTVRAVEVARAVASEQWAER